MKIWIDSKRLVQKGFISMDEKTKELLLTLIENLSEPEYITQQECGEPCIKGKNLRFLKEMIKKM